MENVCSGLSKWVRVGGEEKNKRGCWGFFGGGNTKKGPVWAVKLAVLVRRGNAIVVLSFSPKGEIWADGNQFEIWLS